MSGHHLSLILLTLFAWPAGIVLGNLLANVLWLPVQWAGLHLKLAAHHAAVHARMDLQDAELAEIRSLLEHRRSETYLLPPDGCP